MNIQGPGAELATGSLPPPSQLQPIVPPLFPPTGMASISNLN